MSGDQAGNTLTTARRISAASGLQSFSDRVDTLDPNDYYRFNLNSSASLNLSLQDLTGNANLQLLNQRGELLQASTNAGTSAEAINTVLNSGTYYIRVTPATSTTSANYSLNINLQTNPNIDIFWRNAATGANTQWLMGGTNNTTSVGAVSLQAADPVWQIEAIADFNHDGINDILWREYVGGVSGIWFLDGATQPSLVSIAVLPTASPNWQIEGAADFNHDGTTDILWRDYISGTNGIWFMGGASSTSIASIGLLTAASTNWRIDAIADFNQDGQLDLLWRDYISGVNGIWFLGGRDSLSVTSIELLATRSSNWTIEGAVDFNRDGSPDIFWRDQTTGNNEVWLLSETSNTSILSVAAIDSTPATWQAIPVVRAGQPSIDLAGNSPATAFEVGVLGASAVYQDAVGLPDANDYYRFTLTSRSTFNLALRGLVADADVQLLRADGSLIQASANPGILPESINTTLDAGSYLVRIFPYNQSTSYTLNLAATAIATQNTVVNLTTPDANAAEVGVGRPQNSGQFVISRTGSTSTALTINYSLSGTATNGADFNQISSIVIPVGQTSLTIPITVMDDSLIEDNETVVLTLNSSPGYSLGTSISGIVTIADNDRVNFANFTVSDASGDSTVNTVFQGGALQLSYALPTGTPVSQVRLEAWRNNSMIATLGTWASASLTGAIVNLDAATPLTGGNYLFRAVAQTSSNQEIASVFQPFQVLGWNFGSNTTFGQYTANTLIYAGLPGTGQVFVGRGGTDTLDLGNLARASIEQINGTKPNLYNPLNSIANQAIFRGTAFDYLTLTDGREIYFQGIETLKFADGSLSLQVKPNDPNFGQQWNLHVTDVGSAWRFTQGATNVLLVSWDGGIGGSIGSITDISPSRLITDGRSASDEPEFDELGNRDGGHGHTAISVMGASANNGTGITGINWNSPILVHDNYGDSTNPAETSISLTDSIVEAIALARRNDWKVIVQGGVQGYLWFDGVRSQLEELIQQNSDMALFAVAAGNGSLDIDDETDDSSYFYGGGVASLQTKLGNVIAVGALRPGGASNEWYQSGSGITQVDDLTNVMSVSLASYSNRGPSLTLVAPTDTPAMNRFGELNYFGGTSAANPNMAAIASLVWSVNPALSGTQLRQLLIDTATDLGRPGKDDNFGHGLVNADATVRRAVALRWNQALAELYLGRSEFA
jgi:hypothetical protein